MSFGSAPLPFSQLIEDASSACLRDSCHSLPLWFWESNADDVITYVSDNLERVTGFKDTDLIGLCILEPANGREESEAGLAEYFEALRRRLPVSGLSYERVMLSGERAVLMDSALPQFTDDGEFLGYCGISFHISEALRLSEDNGSLMGSLRDRTNQLEKMLAQRNEELASTNRLLAEVIDALGEGLLVTSGTDALSPENKILFLNPAYKRIMNVTDQEVFPGMTIAEMRQAFVDRGDAPPSSVEDRSQLISDGQSFEVKVPSTGTSVEVKGIPRPDGGMVMVHKDVTRLRAHTNMLEAARREAEQATEAKSNFLASMSHEIRTPMNGILGVADLLADTGLDADQAELVQTISESALALTGLIGDILDFSKIEAGHLTLEATPFNLTILVDDLIKMMTPLAQAKGISLSITMDEGLRVGVLGDKQRIRQIMINLLGNAVKFTPEGSVRMAMSRSEGDQVILEVSDTGVGIPEADIDNIFNSFEQVQSGFRREFEGTGLGLAITKELVQAMDGKIEVVSTEGVGSTFTVLLNLPSVELCGQRSEWGDVPVMDLSDCRILLAEDNRTNQLVARKMLQRLGATPEIVSDGLKACTQFEQQSYDVVILDVSMPVMSGLDAARQMRALEEKNGRKACPIIALTGNAFDSDREDCKRAGMDGFLTKPMRLNELSACLHALLFNRCEAGLLTGDHSLAEASKKPTPST